MLMMEAIMPKACQELICYETLETLGDAFLKFAVSVHLYRLFPQAHEGEALALETFRAGSVMHHGEAQES